MPEKKKLPVGIDNFEKIIKNNFYYPIRRKTPCFSYGDIRRVHRIYASN